MSEIRLYRDIYKFTLSSGTLSQTKVTPYSIGAEVYNSGSTLSIETATPHEEATGRYYVQLNPLLYTFDNVYELVWSVVYEPSAPIKKLKTFFKLKPYNVSSNVELHMEDRRIEVEMSSNIEIIVI
jgi:hypothetical protein